jgi:hypothetical protein
MNYTLKVLPYKMGSASGKSLAQGLGVKRVSPLYAARRLEILINWGNSSLPRYTPHVGYDLNKHSAIALACNKLSTFNALLGADYLPEYTTNKIVASAWLDEGYKVYCRTLLTGHSGNGIVVATQEADLVHAPLYTRDSKHKHEYRVHVFKETVIAVQQKKRRLSWTGGDTGIRNYGNGYIYAIQDLEYPEAITLAAIAAVQGLGLDFGAVDIGYNQHSNKTTLFEVNTAPGLVGTTLTTYINTFKEYLYECNR